MCWGLAPPITMPTETFREAVNGLEKWAKRHLGRLRAAMERLHPATAHVVPEASGLDGAEAVLAVATLLGRVRELELDETNGAVMETLARRGFDAALRRRLAELVEDAQRVERSRHVPALGVETPETNDAPDDELVALHAWYEDWAATARALVERKDWLIRLGLRERPRRRGAGAGEMASVAASVDTALPVVRRIARG